MLWELTFSTECLEPILFVIPCVLSWECKDRLSVLSCSGFPQLWSIVAVQPLIRNSESFAFWEFWLAIDKFRCDTRFIAFGLGFALTDGESSERPSWDLFDMTALCLTCLPFGFGVNILDLNLGIQVDSVEQPIQRNSVSCWHASSLDFFPWLSSLSQLRCLRKCATVTLFQRDVCSQKPDLRVTDQHVESTHD